MKKDTGAESMRHTDEHPFDFSLTTRFKAVHVLGYLQPQRGESILDVGCGLGFFLNSMARRGIKGYGLDYSLKSLSHARHLTAGEVCQGDAQGMPFLDNSFDKIIFTDVLEHVKDDSGTLKEIVRIGRPGSLVALVTPGVRGRLANTGWRKLYHDEEGTPEYDERAGYEPEELRELMEDAGIRVSEVRQTLIFAAEFFLQFTKWFLSNRKVHYQTQGDILDITQTRTFQLYRRLVFPLFYGIGRLEEALLAGRMDGHSLIALGVVDKPATSTISERCEFSAVNG